MLNFHKNLKELRKEHKLTQQQVADKLQMSQQNYQRYEKGIYEPDLHTIVRMANFFKVSLDYLVGRYNMNEVTE